MRGRGDAEDPGHGWHNDSTVLAAMFPKLRISQRAEARALVGVEHGLRGGGATGRVANQGWVFRPAVVGLPDVVYRDVLEGAYDTRVRPSALRNAADQHNRSRKVGMPRPEFQELFVEVRVHDREH